MARKTDRSSRAGNTAAFAVLVYAVWVFATYMLEGRVSLFHRNDPMGRLVYVVVANLAVGLVFSFIVLRFSIRAGVSTTGKMGLHSLVRTIVAIVIFGAVGFGIFAVQKPASMNPVLVINVFSQVLPVSIAEVVVCWALIGTSFEALSAKGGRAVSLVVAIVAADVLFGVYHFGHSAPFNQARMVFFLMIPGLGTSLVYFLVRDLYAAVVFQNFMGIYGVMRSINLEAMKKPAYPLYVLALVSVVLLVCLDVFVARRAGASQR